MYDFLRVERKYNNKLQRNVYSPTYVIKSNIKDLLIRGQKFYAIYNYNTGLWETDDSVATTLIDEQVKEYVDKNESQAFKEDPEHSPIIMRLSDQQNHLINQWHSFCERDYRPEWDPKCQLDQKVIFSNTDVKRSDYASKKLSYPLQEQATPYYDKICEKLYLPEEREKWEWYVGCLLAGDQDKIQKMLVFYGEPGTGKSTIIGKVLADTVFEGFEMGYVSKFEANNLVGRNEFATDFLEKDPVLVYDDDAEMNMITSKTTLNKIISHEAIRVNAKFEKAFVTRPHCLMIVGSNEPVQMSPNSGMNRRLIDVRPTGNRLLPDEYDECISNLQYEKSGIAWRCLQVYKKHGPHYYDHYIAEDMLSRTSPFQNFVLENYLALKDGCSLAAAYKLYTDYAEECNFKNILVRYKFRDTLKLYFRSYDDQKFSGFKYDRIGKEDPDAPKESKDDKKPKESPSSWIELKSQPSIFDETYKDCLAQYEQDNKEHPLRYAWGNCKTTLKDLDTSKVHYVMGPKNLIFLDFDKKGPDGEKDLEENLKMASKFPRTYAEVSKSGGGVHLFYIYTGGDPDKLSRILEDNVEVKVPKGGTSIRRKLTLCNDLPIAEISSGLPFKEEKTKDMVDWEGFENEQALRKFIAKCILKKHHGYTRPEVNFIYKALEEAYQKGYTYDVRDLQNDIFGFASNSTNSAQYCMELVSRMHFCSKDIDEKENIETAEYKTAPIVFFDIEIFPSWKQSHEKGNVIPDDIPQDTPALFLVNWKYQGENQIVHRMINPSPSDVEKLFHFRLIGFNNRKYDNHMLYARSQGYTSEELYDLSYRIIDEKDKNALFGPAYNLSYTDIYDFSASSNRKKLKKWEIELGIKHLEWDAPWYLPVAVKDWPRVAEYCDNDVISAEAVFNHLHEDFESREIMAKLSGLTVNDTTNQHTIAILTHDIEKPQKDYIYTDLSKMTWPDGTLMFPGYEFNPNGFPKEKYIPGTKTINRLSYYRGEDPGEGGHKVGYPGYYTNVALLDIASEHPHSAIRLNIFGDVITTRFKNLVEARVNTKHIKEIGDDAYNSAINYLNQIKPGAGQVMVDFLQGLSGDELRAKCGAIATAMKTAINSVYGLTSAKFDNKLRDPRNVDNIVAKYGALFMINLKHEIWDRGFKVVHVSTDSIKIADATNEIIAFAFDYAKKYGYTFEHEATYDRMVMADHVNYIAHYMSSEECKTRYNDFIPEDNAKAEKEKNKSLHGWTVTGDMFANSYAFKTLFSHEPIIFEDKCVTINANKGSLHLIGNEGTDHETDTFIGAIGQFTPMSKGGSKLYVIRDGKRNAASGTKGYEFLESASVEVNHLEGDINNDYFNSICDDNVKTIEKYVPFEQFTDLENGG